MTGLLRRMVAGWMALALFVPGAPLVHAQDSAQTSGGQVSSTPQGGFVLKENAELVLTNVVVRDAKTGKLVIRGVGKIMAQAGDVYSNACKL